MYVKKGDNIIVSKYSGTEVKYEGTEYLIVKQLGRLRYEKEF